MRILPFNRRITGHWARWPRFLALLLFVALLVPAQAIDVHQFDTPEQEALYRQLTEELRCLVCQNQNIADSDADLAKDLRQEVAEFIKQGKSGQEITDYLVQRYGDFVRYNPPVRADTIILWTLPFALLIFGGLALLRAIRRSGKKNSQEALAEAETRPMDTNPDSNTDTPHE
jgi:cytochrome c-type biogenesis protein CcmH